MQQTYVLSIRISTRSRRHTFFSSVWKVSNRLDLSALSRLCHTRLQLSRHCDLHLIDGASGRHFDKATAHILFTHIWTSRQFLAEESSNTRELEDVLLKELSGEDFFNCFIHFADLRRDPLNYWGSRLVQPWVTSARRNPIPPI